jgi:hypothetical protein
MNEWIHSNLYFSFRLNHAEKGYNSNSFEKWQQWAHLKIVFSPKITRFWIWGVTVSRKTIQGFIYRIGRYAKRQASQIAAKKKVRKNRLWKTGTTYF